MLLFLKYLRLISYVKLLSDKVQVRTECPAKLFYVGKPEYADEKKGDSFLQALAEGGFQVGELAKKYYPDGITVESKDPEYALQQTAELMKIHLKEFYSNRMFIKKLN